MIIEWFKIDAVPPGIREVACSQIFSHSGQTDMFRGSWRNVMSEPLNAFIVMSDTIADELSFTNIGDRFCLNVTRHEYSSQIHIEIDGNVTKLVDLYAVWQEWTPNVLSVSDLGEGEHFIRVINWGRGEFSHGDEIWLRSVFVSEVSYFATMSKSTGEVNVEPVDVPLQNCLNIFSRQDQNIGDRRSSPILYFQFLEKTPQAGMFDWHPRMNTSIDSRQAFNLALNTKNIIIGGGGLLATEYFNPALDYIRYGSRCKSVLWGVGHNSPQRSHWTSEFNAYDFSAAHYELVGVRDWGTRFRWVPCASCMSPELSAEYEVKRELGFLMHAGELETLMRVSHDNPEADFLDNFSEFDKVCEFIGESETIVTNSFHATYWATLMKRRVIAIPTSSKFFSFKHPVILSNIDDWRSALPKTCIYEEALEECRAANLDFARDVYLAFSE